MGDAGDGLSLCLDPLWMDEDEDEDEEDEDEEDEDEEDEDEDEGKLIWASGVFGAA